MQYNSARTVVSVGRSDVLTFMAFLQFGQVIFKLMSRSRLALPLLFRPLLNIGNMPTVPTPEFNRRWKFPAFDHLPDFSPFKIDGFGNLFFSVKLFLYPV